MHNPPSKILIVDDEARNRELLVAIVSSDDREVVAVADGFEAIEEFKRTEYDLVLLDVMMPGLDGLATIPRLRALTPPEQHVPIVLVTALDARDDRIRGLDAGADDFLTKPVDAREVRCRVRTFLALRATQRALLQRAAELEAVQRSKAELAAMVVHDLKNPLAAISGNVRWIANRWNTHRDSPDMVDALDDLSSSTQRLVGLVSTLIEVEKAESGQLRIERCDTDAAELLSRVARQHRKEAEDRSIVVDIEAPSTLRCSLDETLVTRAMENLLLNALRYAGSGGRISLQARRAGDALELCIANTGRPIAPELRDSLFQKYATSERRARGDNLGLGLYFCRLVAEGHGGSIAADTSATWPTQFLIRVPQ